MYADIFADLIISKVLTANTVYTEESTRKKKMHRTRWGVIQKHEGETEYYLNGKTYVSNKTNMVIIPSGTTYDWLCTKSGHYTIFEFECQKEYYDILTFRISEQLSARILRRLSELEYIMTLKSPLSDIRSIHEAYGIILMLAESSQKEYSPMMHFDKIKPAVEFIAKNYSRAITNRELSEMCGISEVYFRKLFTEHIGASPINYIHSVRIEKAKEMLCLDYSNITDIALSLGYSSIYDFSRTFKKLTGLSPKSFSKEASSKQHNHLR